MHHDADFVVKQPAEIGGLPPKDSCESSEGGLHVAVPLTRTEEFDAVRAFARDVAAIVVSQAPRKRTLELLKNKRHGRVFVDANRNAYVRRRRRQQPRAKVRRRPRP